MVTSLSSEWRQWLDDNLSRGVSERSLADTMLENNLDRDTVFQEIAEAVGRKQKALSDTSNGNCIAITEDTTGWYIAMQLEKPRIILYENFMTTEECDQLIALSMPKLSQSTIVDTENGELRSHKDRVSRGTYFALSENPFISMLDQRVARLMQCPVENEEPLQILNYQVGGEYKPHFDYFPPEQTGSANHLKRGGQRVATLIMYLNTVSEGGETIFPELNLKVAARKGSAIYFSYFENGTVDPLSLHAGSPILQGEKWIATKWIRERAYC
jgi:prolyl 4-hydroxylase